MKLLTIIAIAIGLALDAFTVSIACGFTVLPPKRRNVFKIATSFGLFQAGMPLLGWAVGLSFSLILQQFDHWIAFGLLTIIGIHMIYESTQTECRHVVNPSNNITLLSLSLATSIDAFAVGITFAFLKIHIITPIAIIGIVTFGISLIGLFIGHKLGVFFGRKVEVFGGLVLISIGLKILVEGINS